MAHRREYAEDTDVPVERSRQQIDLLLSRAGAAQRAFATDDEAGVATVQFVLRNARYRVLLILPTRDSFSRADKYPQACRARWRVLLLLLKAKFEAIRLGLSSPEKEFLADMVCENGKTVSEELPQWLRLGMGSERALPPAGRAQ